MRPALTAVSLHLGNTEQRLKFYTQIFLLNPSVLSISYFVKVLGVANLSCFDDSVSTCRFFKLHLVNNCEVTLVPPVNDHQSTWIREWLDNTVHGATSSDWLLSSTEYTLLCLSASTWSQLAVRRGQKQLFASIEMSGRNFFSTFVQVFCSLATVVRPVRLLACLTDCMCVSVSVC